MFSKLFQKKVQEKDLLQPRRIPRAPRIFLGQENQFVLQIQGNEKFALLNLSESGVAFSSPRPLALAPLTGKLTLFDRSLDIELQVVRVSEGMIGCSVRAPAEAYGKLIRDLFQAEIQICQMNEVSTQHLQVEEGENPRWFLGQDCEAFIGEKEGKLTRVEIFSDGFFYLLHPGKQPKAGKVPASAREKVSHARSDLVQWKDQLSETERERLPRLVRNIPGLSPAETARVLALLVS